MQFPGTALDNALVFEYGEHRFEQEPDIVEKAPFFDVFAVKLCLDGDLQFVSAADLRQPCQSRFHVVGVVQIPFGDQVVLVPQGGSRTDETHLTGENVEQLRQLVDRRFPDELSDLGDVRVRVIQLMRGGVRIGVGIHGAELQDLKDLLVLPDPVLFEEHGALAVEFDGERHDQHRESKENDRKKGAEQIERSFEEGIDRLFLHLMKPLMINRLFP